MSSPADMDVYVVDVCGTLVRDDTTLGLLRFHFARTPGRRIRIALFNAMTSQHSPVRLAFVILESLTGRHFLKRAAVQLLAGDRAALLGKNAVQYASVLLKTRRIASVWELIEQPANGGRVVLASASLEPVIACLASAIGARHVASQLEEKDGVLTGRYAKDLTGQKALAIQEKYGEKILNCHFCVISDNFSDRALLEQADQAFVVLHCQAHLQRWVGLNAIFLEV